MSAGQNTLIASGGEWGDHGRRVHYGLPVRVGRQGAGRCWSGGGGYGSGRGGRGGSNGEDGEAGTGDHTAPGGRGSGAVELPRIPGLSLAPGRGGEPDGGCGGGGGGVTVNRGPEWTDTNCGEGYGGGSGEYRVVQARERTNGVVIFY